MHTDGELVRLSRLIPLLLSDGWEPPPYLVLWRAALNGDIPAEQVNGRWHIRTDNAPAIARALKLRRSQQPVAA
jgi:hypothetical protein